MQCEPSRLLCLSFEPRSTPRQRTVHACCVLQCINLASVSNTPDPLDQRPHRLSWITSVPPSTTARTHVISSTFFVIFDDSASVAINACRFVVVPDQSQHHRVIIEPARLSGRTHDIICLLLLLLLFYLSRIRRTFFCIILPSSTRPYIFIV
jgi:hypothetical protein